MIMIGFCIGLVVMYLIAGIYVYIIGGDVNRFFLSDKGVTILAILTWPGEVRRVMNAGITTGKDLKARPNVNP